MDFLRCDDRLRFELGLAYRRSFEEASFIKPGARRGRAPEGLALRIREVPPDGLVIGIHRLVVAAVDLHAISVGIADVKKKGIRDAMPSWSAFDVGQISSGRHKIQKVDDMERRLDPECHVVQTRASAVGEGDVVNAPFAMHPHRPQQPRLLIFGVFGHAEAHLVVKGGGAIDIGGEAVEMIDAQGPRAAIERILLMDGGSESMRA